MRRVPIRTTCVLATALFAPLLGADTAHAGWSVVAGDRASRRVGAVGASCIASMDGAVAVMPDVGAVTGDGIINVAGVAKIADLISHGQTIDDSLNAVKAAFESGYRQRQYGVFSLAEFDAPQAFTGDLAPDWSGDMQVPGVSVQGARVADETFVEPMLAPFVDEPPQCPYSLADRLMAALEVGAAAGGDTLCAPDQVARTAYLIVARPFDTMEEPELEIVIPDQGLDGMDPVMLLRQEYDLWRAENPPDSTGCDGGTGTTGGVGTGTGGDPDTSGTTGSDPGTTSGTGEPPGGASTAGDVSTSGAQTGGTETTGAAATTGGGSGLPPGRGGDLPSGAACACRQPSEAGAGPSQATGWFWLVLLGVTGRRPRRPARRT